MSEFTVIDLIKEMVDRIDALEKEVAEIKKELQPQEPEVVFEKTLPNGTILRSISGDMKLWRSRQQLT